MNLFHQGKAIMKHIEQIDDPIELFDKWYKDAEQIDSIQYPNAVCLSTVDERDRPSNRMVLLKAYDKDGFTFFTNLKSRKGKNLEVNPFAALCFYWQDLGRQIRVEGKIEQIPDEEADEYFQTRPRGSQIGAWASKQSEVLESRYALEKRVMTLTAKYSLRKVPRPDHWSGFRIQPDLLEFWLEKKYRLHERLQFRKVQFEKMQDWKKEWLYP